MILLIWQDQNQIKGIIELQYAVLLNYSIIGLLNSNKVSRYHTHLYTLIKILSLKLCENHDKNNTT